MLQIQTNGLRFKHKLEEENNKPHVNKRKETNIKVKNQLNRGEKEKINATKSNKGSVILLDF